MRELPEFMPSFLAKYLLEAWAAAIGQPAFVTSTVAELTGCPARTFFESATDHRRSSETFNSTASCCANRSRQVWPTRPGEFREFRDSHHYSETAHVGQGAN